MKENNQVAGFRIANNTADSKKYILYGHCIYCLSTNYGSDTGVSITPVNIGVSYAQHLWSSGQQSFDIGLLRIYSKNLEVFDNPVNITTIDKTGETCSLPLFNFNKAEIKKIEGDRYAYDFKPDKDITINGKTFLWHSLPAATDIDFVIFTKNIQEIKYRDASDIKIIVENTSNEVRTVNLFHAYENILKEYFGNSKDIKFSSTKEITYMHLLSFIATGIKGKKLRIWAENRKQAENTITEVTQSIYGECIYYPLPFENKATPAANGWQVDVENWDIKIDGRFSMHFSILPNTKVEITINPTE